MKRISRAPLLVSFVLFILLCVSASFWVMQFTKAEPRKIVAPPASKPVPDVESVAGLFGGALAVNSNYQLKGIVLANPQTQSEAIIAVDGKPSQAFTVHSEISPGVKVTEVHAGYVMITDNGVSKRVELPAEFKSAMQSMDGAVLRAPVNSPSYSGYSGSGSGVHLADPENSLAGRNNRGRATRQIPQRQNGAAAPDVNYPGQGASTLHNR